ncbi:MAG: hypothetical protein PHS54_07435 [Clostridia bacterium]|nr:hypothetical protein [Clostridia bacterium]
MKYKVLYFEDDITCIAETIIKCDDETQLKKLVDEFYEKELKDMNIAGAKWLKID